MIKKSKSCAIMQPYFFPSFQYFQHMHSVDKFIFYDDCNMKKKSFISRNHFTTQKYTKDQINLTLRINKLSQNKKINQHTLYDDQDFEKIVENNLSNFKYYFEIVDIFKYMKSISRKQILLSEYLISSLNYIAKKLLGKTFELKTSDMIYNKDLDNQTKLISIIKMNKCSSFVNTPGGKNLYSKKFFHDNKLELFFINSKLDDYYTTNSVLLLIAKYGITELKKLINLYKFE